MTPLFALAGNRATLDADVAFHGMTFRAAEGETGFTLARDAAENAHGLTLYGGRVAACSTDAALTAHTYVIDAPLALDGPVTFHADKEQTLILSNAFCDTALGNGVRSLAIDGTGVSAHTNYGHVVFAGTNYFGGIYYVFFRGCRANENSGIVASTFGSFEELENLYKEIIA